MEGGKVKPLDGGELRLHMRKNRVVRGEKGRKGPDVKAAMIDRQSRAKAQMRRVGEEMKSEENQLTGRLPRPGCLVRTWEARSCMEDKEGEKVRCNLPSFKNIAKGTTDRRVEFSLPK